MNGTFLSDSESLLSGRLATILNGPRYRGFQFQHVLSGGQNILALNVEGLSRNTESTLSADGLFVLNTAQTND